MLNGRDNFGANARNSVLQTAAQVPLVLQQCLELLSAGGLTVILGENATQTTLHSLLFCNDTQRIQNIPTEELAYFARKIMANSVKTGPNS